MLATLSMVVGCGSSNNDDTTSPLVSSTLPLNAATGVDLGGDVAVTFSEAMDPSTISSATLSMKQGSRAIAAIVSYSGVTATLNPSATLEAGKVYTVTVATGAKDLAANTLAEAHVWSFTTGVSVDTTAPTLLTTLPDIDALNVAANLAIEATFSEALNPSTLNDTSFRLVGPGITAVTGTVSYANSKATFTPTADLALDTLFNAVLSTDIKDLAGNAFASDFSWSFRTTTAVDLTSPTVVSTLPILDAVDVATNRGVRVRFSEAMDLSTLGFATFKLVGPGTTVVDGTMTTSPTRATFTPLARLALDTLYEVTITTGVKDLAGNALASDYVWSFRTSAIDLKGPDPVILGRAGDFVILAKSGIDTVPASAITGDIGVSPIDSTALTGFSLSLDATNAFATSGQVTGQVFAADYSVPTPSGLTTSISNMETAYTDAAGRPTPDFTNLGAGEIGGLTLVPGLYKWGTGVSISTDVTLDGGPNDVWIFQISGDVTQASGTKMTLSGGASPHNIFWQTFGQLMIGTTAHFEGIALCQTAIVLGTGASVNGRLLAQTAVTLDQNAVTQPEVQSL